MNNNTTDLKYIKTFLNDSRSIDLECSPYRHSNDIDLSASIIIFSAKDSHYYIFPTAHSTAHLKSVYFLFFRVSHKDLSTQTSDYERNRL